MSIGSAIIGALRVNLGLDSAEFTAGLKVAKGELGAFGKFAKTSLVALAGVAVGLASAFGVAAKGAIDHADALSKMSQKAGVSTESLSRLAYAASFSEVSLEDTTAALGKLSKTMADAAQNTKGTAASAFAALGISVTDASGHLRDADDVFTDIADRFARIHDGATKTAIAMTLFGKSGAQLIPVLNEGADGLKRYADESDRTGNTISTKFATAANRFNDSLSGIGKKISGIVFQLVGSDGFLSALDRISDTLSDPKFMQAAHDIGQAVIDGIAGALPYLKNFANNISIIHDMLVDFSRMTEAGQRNVIAGVQNQITELENHIQENQQRLAQGGASTLFGLNDASLKDQIAKDIAAVQPLIDKMAELQRTMTGGVTPGSGPTSPSTFDFRSVLDRKKTKSNDDIDLSKFTDGVSKAQQVIDPFEARVEELSDALTATVDPFSQMKMDLTDLQTMFDAGRISAAQFGDAIVKTAAGGVGAFADLAGGLTGALSEMFKQNKAIAVANAIVNGIGSVAKTFEVYGATPWGFVAAGIAATTAAANVASILSTQEGSTSIPGGGGSGSGGAAPAAVAPRGPTFHLTLKGSTFSAQQIEDLIGQINQHLSDGGTGFVTP
jgi:hypothetical protein